MTETEEPKTGTDRPDGDSDQDFHGAFAAVVGHIDEIRRQLERLVSIRFDRTRLKVRESAVKAAVGVVLVGLAVTIVVVSVLRLFAGIAGGLTVALGGRAWAGDLLGGLLGLLLLGSVALLALRRSRKQQLKRLVEKYEGRSRGNPSGGRSSRS